MYSYSGVGEIGIDLYWDKTHIKEQVDAFRQQLFYARRNNLPVVIHARESFHEILEIVKTNEFAGLNGIFHAFTGDKKLAELIVGMGFKLGIGGILTFKNSFSERSYSGYRTGTYCSGNRFSLSCTHAF
jgi:TatD DNase family protein